MTHHPAAPTTFSERVLQLPTHKACPRTIEHAIQGDRTIAEKSPHQKLPFPRRTGCCRSGKSVVAKNGAPLQPLSTKDFFSFQHTELVRGPSSMQYRVSGSVLKKALIKNCHFRGGPAAADLGNPLQKKGALNSFSHFQQKISSASNTQN